MNLRIDLRRIPLAGRITVLTALAVGLAVAVVSSAAYFTVRAQLLNSIDSSLYTRASKAAEVGNTLNITPSAPGWIPGATDVHLRQVFANGQVRTSDAVAWTREAPLWGEPELAVATGDRLVSARTIESTYGPYRVVAVPIPNTESALVLAQALAPVNEALHNLSLVLLGGSGLGVMAAGFAGWFVARRGLRPVRELTEVAEEIARTEQLDPIEVGGKDEVARLAVAFNQMLASLAASRDRQKQLVADAGHELRTPLTSLRTNLDLLSQAERSGGTLPPGARQELLDDVRFQIDELTTLIGDLTELARDEHISAAVETVDFDGVVGRALERVRRRGHDLRFDVRLDPWWVVGEASSLERAVTNVLDNAAKWSPPGGTVTVRLTEGTLTVADEGPGIDPDDLPHIFDRFYRSKESRTMPGSGLGLAIVRQIFTRHGGAVWVSSSDPDGTTVTATMPGSAGEPRLTESA